MLDPTLPITIYMEGASNSTIGKMGFGLLRYSPNPIVCVVDSQAEFQDMRQTGRTERACPIVGTVAQAVEMGAKALVLGTAPPGGLIPNEWWADIELAIANGLSVVNGLHDRLAPRFQILKSGQWIWDIRVEPERLSTGKGLAAKLDTPRLLTIGTDMAVGKMTTGLEFQKAAQAAGIATEFVATGQIGIAITGHGVPLDAVRVDFASSAIEREVLAAAARLETKTSTLHPAPGTLIIIEGQGALIHPSSTANLPLLRGSCPTHLLLCTRGGQTSLRLFPDIAIPPLLDYIRLYEDLAEACGTFLRPKPTGVALNTAEMNTDDALRACEKIESETGLPCTDPLRHGCERWLIDFR